MVKYLLLLAVFIPQFHFSQSSHLLTNEEKAYLYHIVKKSPVLDRNIGDLFHYSGEIKKGKDSLIDYYFIENEIKKEPSLLNFQMQELAESPSGILAELSVKMALWNLYNELKISLENQEQKNELIQSFFQEIIQNAPKELLIEKKESTLLSKKALETIHPNITLNERIELVAKLGLSKEQQKDFLETITLAIQNYTDLKAKSIYKMLGGNFPNYQNMMLAAGDGSGTSGLLGEKELIEKDISQKEKENQKEKQNKGIGLYTYDLQLTSSDNKEKISPSIDPYVDFVTEPNHLTNIHLSIWGFNYSTQTTVVITKGEKTYLLYGSKQTGELSPDTVANTKTYNVLLSELNGKIAEKNAEVYGAKGLEFRVKDYKAQREEVLLKIKKTEYKESSLQVVGNRPNKRKTKYSGEHKDGAVYTQFDKGQDKIKVKGSELSRLHAQLDWLNQKIKEFEEEFQLQKTNLDVMEQKSQRMKKNMGVNKVPFKIKDYVIYEFEDGATFNLKTQDFKFPPSENEENFRIQLLAVPLSAMSEYADEIQLNISITEDQKENEFDEIISLELKDVFNPNDFRLKELPIDAENEYLISKYMKYLAFNKIPLESSLKGGGIGFVVNGEIKSVLNQQQLELVSYPGETNDDRLKSSQSNEYKSLRATKVRMELVNKRMYLYINSFTDPVKSTITKKYSKLSNLKKRNEKLTDNEILSALRSMRIYDLLIEKMKREMETLFKDDVKMKKKMTSQLDDIYNQTYIDINGMSVSIKELEGYVK